MVIVSLTSWTERINHVKIVIESIMNNNRQPDKVYLNLSSTEFKNINLPDDLINYFNTDKRLIINWVDGENTKPMKKIFPILKYLDDDDIIIDADDDILFPRDFIESRLADFKTHGGGCCITSNPKTSIGFNGRMKVMSAMSLFTKKMLKNWEKILTENIIRTYNDDRTYLHLLWLNGYTNVPCSKYDIFCLLEKYAINIGYGMTENKTHLIGKKYDEVMKKEYAMITGKDINDSFGFWKNDMSVAITAISRLENDYINEWIGHHLDIGIDHIYVYDNSSMDEEKLSGAIHEKYLDRVTVIPVYGKTQYQRCAYKESYEQYGNEYDYMIYIDIDEFIILQKDKDIKDFIRRFPDDLECYRMNWEIYGDAGIINRDVSSSVLKDFKKPSFNTRKNTTTKSIIKGGIDHIDFLSVHYAIRNENGKKSNLITYFGDMKNITEKISRYEKSIDIYDCDYTYVKLNHYMTKSVCEFICQKMRRPDAARDYVRNMDRDFFRYNAKTEEKIKEYEKSKKILTYYYWSPKKFENAGDYYNRILINKLYYCNCIPASTGQPADIVFCGSVLADPSISNSKYIIGCGFQNSLSPSNKNPDTYLAVRGRMTRDRLMEYGIQLNNNIKFVDPGLMVSRIYDMGDVPKKYDIGIIPHYVDEDTINERYGNKYRIISMKTPDILSVCRQISECGMILSSSLHGIIFAHALGVPAYHIEISPLQDGDNFKFKDYYSSYDDVHYEVFKCRDSVIPFDIISKYDQLNRTICNPTRNEVSKKQDEFLSILPYRQYLNKKYLKNKVCICLTSYKKRICNIKNIIESLFNQTIDTDIYLTLSSDEFPEKENELPEYLKTIRNPRFHINWVKENTRSFKKSLYTLNLIDDESIIITVDDDVILENDVIEMALNHFDGENPLTISNKMRSVGYSGLMHTPSGCFTVYTKNMVKHWDEIINKNIISTNDDDSFMIAMFWLNGYYNKYIPVNLQFDTNMESIGSLTHHMKVNECRDMARKSDKIIDESFYGISGKHLYESFGYFNESRKGLKPEIKNYNNEGNATRQDKTKLRIKQLRKDIMNGNVIRVLTSTGYCWKKVK